MDDIHILVVHSRGEYNYMVYDWWHSCLSFLCLLCILFKKLVSDSGNFLHIMCIINFHCVCTECIRTKPIYIPIWDMFVDLAVNEEN